MGYHKKEKKNVRGQYDKGMKGEIGNRYACISLFMCMEFFKINTKFKNGIKGKNLSYRGMPIREGEGTSKSWWVPLRQSQEAQ